MWNFSFPENLKQRSRDIDENVRYEVVVAIVNAGKENLSCISEELLMFVKERTLDKKVKKNYLYLKCFNSFMIIYVFSHYQMACSLIIPE